MRALRLGLVVATLLALGLACTGNKDDEVVDSDGQSSSTGDDTEEPTDDSEANTEDTSYGEDFDPTDPKFTVQIAGASWSTDQGFWTKTSLSANIPDNTQAEVVTIIVDGDLRYAGTYPVSSMNYSQTPSQGTPVIYNSSANPSVTVTVLGFSDDNTNLFATIDGSTDLDGIAFEGGDVVGWPPF